MIQKFHSYRMKLEFGRTAQGEPNKWMVKKAPQFHFTKNPIHTILIHA
jgi:hypothetical protein